MYSKLPNLVIGFHGCDKKVYETVLYHHEPIKKTDNAYDWLGHGIYFWENNYQRAYYWAVQNMSQLRSKIKDPAVIGAVIDLGNCLNLTDNKSIDVIKNGYEMLKYQSELLNKKMPQNINIGDNKDLIKRNLDCAVIQQIHEFNSSHNIQSYDSVRGVFIEGDEIYPNSGFRQKTHIQLCIINPNCIKGYFNPLTPDTYYAIP